jgi:YVTN family beta-propeller protein
MCGITVALWSATSGCHRETSDHTIRTLSVPPETVGLAPPNGPFLYVSNEGGRTVSVISLPTQRVIATIPVGYRPRGIHVSPDGKTVYVALSGSPRCPPTLPDAVCDTMVADKSRDGIAAIDVMTQHVVRTLPGGSDPEQFDVSPDGTRLYIANEDSSMMSAVDIAHGTVVSRTPIGREPEGVRVSPDGRVVFVTSEGESTVTAVDANSGRVLRTTRVGKRPRNVIFIPDSANGGRLLYVSSEEGGVVTMLNANTGAVLARIALPAGTKPMGLALSPDEGRLYVSTGRHGTIEVIDTKSRRDIASVKVGRRPWGIALTPDGKWLYTADGPSNTVSVVNTDSLRTTATIPVGALPWGVVLVPPDGKSS